MPSTAAATAATVAAAAGAFAAAGRGCWLSMPRDALAAAAVRWRLLAAERGLLTVALGQVPDGSGASYQSGGRQFGEEGQHLHSHVDLDGSEPAVPTANDVRGGAEDALCGSRCVGITLSYLEAIQELAQDVADECGLGPRITTEELMRGVVLPAMSRLSKRSSLINTVPSKFKGPPQWVVSHAWPGAFDDLVDAVTWDLAPQPGPTEPPMPAGFKDGVTLWIDLFCVDLYHPLADHPSAAAGWSPPVLRALPACSQGLVLAADARLCFLTWLPCLYEVFWVGNTRDTTAVRLALPPGLRPADVTALHSAVMEGVDFAKGDAFSSAERTRMLSELRRKCGMQRSAAVVDECLRTALHSKLRWRSGAWGQAMFAVLALRGSDLLPLQVMLLTIAELRDSEKSIEEMRRIFMCYDADGSGELDEDEFVQVLMAAGYGESEAGAAFREVNTDGEGGVSIDEFEAWWRNQSDSKGDDSKQGASELTHGALMDKVAALAAYLARLGELEVSEHLRDVHARRRGEAPAAAPLTAPLPRGNLVSTIDTVIQRVDAGELSVAAKLVHRMLLANAELLSVDVADLPLPDAASPADGPAALPELLATYMDVAADMLRHQGAAFTHQLQYILASSAELRAGVVPGSGGRGGSAGGSADVHAGRRSLAGNRVLLRQMLQAKYGGNVALTKKVLKDTQVAISQLTASKKEASRQAAHAASAHAGSSTIGSTQAQRNSMAELAVEQLPPLYELRAKLHQSAFLFGASPAAAAPPHPQARPHTSSSVQRHLSQMGRRSLHGVQPSVHSFTARSGTPLSWGASGGAGTAARARTPIPSDPDINHCGGTRLRVDLPRERMTIDGSRSGASSPLLSLPRNTSSYSSLTTAARGPLLSTGDATGVERSSVSTGMLDTMISRGSGVSGGAGVGVGSFAIGVGIGGGSSGVGVGSFSIGVGSDDDSSDDGGDDGGAGNGYRFVGPCPNRKPHMPLLPYRKSISGLGPPQGHDRRSSVCSAKTVSVSSTLHSGSSESLLQLTQELSRIQHSCGTHVVATAKEAQTLAGSDDEASEPTAAGKRSASRSCSRNGMASTITSRSAGRPRIISGKLPL